MMNAPTEMSPSKIARVAGLLYLFNAITAGFSQSFRTSLIVPGDAAATVAHILASESLFRLSIVSDVLAQISQVFLVLVLYVLLSNVNKSHAILMILFVAGFVPMVCLNMLNQFAALFLLSGAGYLSVFSPDQVHALVLLFLDLHRYGYAIVNVFFGLWLFPLGYLVFKSGYFPKVLGVLLMIGCFGYVINFLVTFLLPGHDVLTYPGLAVSTIAELSFVFWLLIKGARVPDGKPA